MNQQPRHPFDERSPFEVLERARRKRVFIQACNFMLSVGIIVYVPFVLMMIFTPTWQTVQVCIVTVATAPVAAYGRRLARKHDQTERGGFILTLYFLFIIGHNGLLIEGLFPAVAPSYAAFTVLAGIVIGSRGGYIVGFLGAIMWIVGALVLNTGLVPSVSVLSTVLTVIVSVIIIVDLWMIAFFSDLATRDLRRALTDATYDLSQVNAELQEASQLKSMFMANTSHELRTPLSSIMVFTDLTLREAYGPITDKQEENLGRVLHNAKRLNLLINDLLDLSRIEAGELTIVEEEFELNNLIETLRSTVEQQAEEKQLEFSIQQQDNLPKYIVGDEQRLSQIMINLTHNAIKFTEQGEVAVNISSPTNDKWVFSVRDTGRGIHQKDLDMIFEAFRQAGKPSDEVTMHGTGLGLAITRHLVDLMSGDVKVQSQYGKGSTFTVTLPLKTVPAIPSPSQIS